MTTTTHRSGRRLEIVDTVKIGPKIEVERISRFYDGERNETIYWYVEDGGYTRSSRDEFEMFAGKDA